MKLVCASCKVLYIPKTNGVYVEELLEDGSPYKVWLADLLICPICKVEVIAGFGQNPIKEHFEEDYAAFVSFV